MTNNLVNRIIPKAEQLTAMDVLGSAGVGMLFPFTVRGIQCPVSYLIILASDRGMFGNDICCDYVITKQDVDFTAVSYRLEDKSTVDPYGYVVYDGQDINVARRVKWKWSEIKDYCQNVRRADDGVLEADYGLWFGRTYLQDELMLESMYQKDCNDKIVEGIPFCLSTMIGNDSGNFKLEENFVYGYEDGLYSRLNFAVNPYFFGSSWCELGPIRLWVDEERDVAVSEEAVIIGVSDKNIDDYLDKYFSKEVFLGASLKQQGLKYGKMRKLVKTKEVA